MQNLTPKGNWKMAAILGLEEEKVKKACKEVKGFVVPANFNTNRSNSNLWRRRSCNESRRDS